MKLLDIIIIITGIIDIGTIFILQKSSIKNNKIIKYSISSLIFGMAIYVMLFITMILISNNITLIDSVTIENNGEFVYYAIQAILLTPSMLPYVARIAMALGMFLLSKYYLSILQKEQSEKR